MLTVSHMAQPARAPYAAAIATGIWSRLHPFAFWWCATSASYDMKYIPNPWNSLHIATETKPSAHSFQRLSAGHDATHRARVAPWP